MLRCPATPHWLGALIGCYGWKKPEMPQQRSFADAFKGTAEIKAALAVVGQVAINHARMEEALNYLVWQLRAYERATRKSQANRPEADIQADLRNMRREKTRQLIRDKLADVGTLLSHERIAKRLNDLGETAQVKASWEQIASRTEALSEKRNDIIHSAVGWSAERLVRQIGSVLDKQPEPIDLEIDKQLANDLGTLMIDYGTFTTNLGGLLPFKANDLIITSVGTVDLNKRR
jgi:hypothetical protein